MGEVAGVGGGGFGVKILLPFFFFGAGFVGLRGKGKEGE